MRIYLTLVLFLFFGLQSIRADNPYKTVKDLRQGWLKIEDGKFVPTKGNIPTIYFSLEASKWHVASLKLSSRHKYYLFLNSELVTQKTGTLILNIDSLRRLYQGDLFFGIHQDKNITSLSSEIVIKGSSSNNEMVRKQDHFLNFSIIASLTIIICFTILFRSTPQLTFDYFNVMKLLSVQERDESQFPMRIAASANLLFYIFCSFLTSLLILTIFHFAHESISLAYYFPITSTSQGLLQWVILVVIIFIILMAKLLLLIMLSALFGFRDAAGFQFFSFIRLLLVTITIILLVTTIYFIFHVQDGSYFYALLKFLSILLAGGTVIFYFKLMRKMPYRFFHLFSYLWVSEIIPLMILVKLFFN